MEELHSIFDNVNEWLKFAEAKHSGLIALSSAIMLATPAILKQPTNKLLRLLFLVPAVLFGVSIFISLNSFSPKLDRLSFKKEKYIAENHYFFESIAKMDNHTFRKNLSNKSDTLSHLDNDLIDQIISNSQITSLKMKSFKKSLMYFQIGFAVLAILFLLQYFFVNSKSHS